MSRTKSKITAWAQRDTPIVKEFFKAAEHANFRRIDVLLKKGISIHTYNLSGRTILHIAAGNCNIPVMRKFLSIAGSDIDVMTLFDSHTSLYEAVLAEQLTAVEYLLYHNANPNLSTANGETAVHVAVKRRNMAILRILVDFKSSLNKPDVFRNTPLSLAIFAIKDLRMATFLLTEGALVNHVAYTPLPMIHEMVLNCFTDKDMSFVKLLIQYGANAKCVDANGRNSLHLAAIAGLPIVIQYLLQIGVSPFVQDDLRRTPLDIAKEHANIEAVNILKQYFDKDDNGGKDDETEDEEEL